MAIFYDYGDPAEVIKLADFAKYNIITSPANGDMLTFVDNNSQPIEVTCKQVPEAAAADPELESKTAKTWNLTVYKAGTVVEWPSRLSASFKQILSDIDLSAHTSNGAGRFEWDAPGDRVYTGETATIGLHEHRLTFIPNDHGNYESYTIRVNVRVTAGIEMVRVEAGSFTMGSDDGGEIGASPAHTVTLSAFNIGKYEVTQEQYITVMAKNPSYFHGGSGREAASGENQGRRPVEYLEWLDAARFCNILSVGEGLEPVYSMEGSTEPNKWLQGNDSTLVCNWSANGYRLPTEAQWEYAAKGGPLAAAPYYTYAGSDDLDEAAWHVGNSCMFSHNEGEHERYCAITHEVGLKKPNQLGLYDMTGNVNEFIWDNAASNNSPEAYTSSARIDPLGPSDHNNNRLMRGGGIFYNKPSSEFDVIYRGGTYWLSINEGNGFRVVRPVD